MLQFAQPKSEKIKKFNLIALNFDSVVNMQDDELFYKFCRQNADLQIERSEQGEVVVMSPAGFETSHRNASIVFYLQKWALEDQSGFVTDSSGAYRLPNGAVYAPDAAWILRSRVVKLTAAEKKRFIPLAPDFVIELRSPSDSLEYLQEKMVEYMKNGVRLGWLIDPEKRQVFVYRPDEEPETVKNPSELSGGSVLPGFVLPLKSIWESAL